jgi:hypothetical protein
MSKRSKWKNTPEGKTVKRNSVAQYFASRPVELIASPAMRVLSRAAHLALLRIELELRQHAGNGNGKLFVTKEQFIEYGLHQDAIAPALRELDAIGIVIITVHGRGGNAEHRQPNRFLVITNPWKRLKPWRRPERWLLRPAKPKIRTRLATARKLPAKTFPGHGNHA